MPDHDYHGCDACKAKDWEMIDAGGIYCCHTCLSIHTRIPATVGEAEWSRLSDVLDAFREAHPGYQVATC